MTEENPAATVTVATQEIPTATETVATAETETETKTGEFFDVDVFLVKSIRDENAFYAASGDPAMQRVGRINQTLANVLLRLLTVMGPSAYDATVRNMDPQPDFSEPPLG